MPLAGLGQVILAPGEAMGPLNSHAHTGFPKAHNVFRVYCCALGPSSSIGILRKLRPRTYVFAQPPPVHKAKAFTYY